MAVTRSPIQPITPPLAAKVTEGRGSNAYGLGQAALARADSLLATPNPSVTVGTLVPSSTASGIASAVREYAWNRAGSAMHASVRVLGGLPQQADINFPRYDYASSLRSIVTYAPGTETGVALTYLTQYGGTAIDLLFRYAGASTNSEYWVYVDDQYVTQITASAVAAAGVGAGSLVRVPLTFSSAASRVIRIVTRGFGEFAGYDRQPASSLSLPALPSGSRRTLFVGDSYVEGTSAGSSRHFTAWQYPMLGAQDVWCCGSGSTGYIQDGTRTSLTDRYTNDIISQAPEVCVVMMGLNDLSGYIADSSTFGPAVGAMYDALLAALPSTRFMIFGPWSPKGEAYSQPELLTMDTQLASIAAARNIPFFSPIRAGWITGNGKDTAPTGNGNSDTYISSDGTHPNAAGHKYLGWRIAGVLRSRGLA